MACLEHQQPRPSSPCSSQVMPWEARNGAAVDYALQEVVREYGQDDEVRVVLLYCTQ